MTLFWEFASPDLHGDGPHTYHPGTFGLLYGKTTKTACSKRVKTEKLVRPMAATCIDCQSTIIEVMVEAQKMHDVALDWAKQEGFSSLEEWHAAILAERKRLRGSNNGIG